MSLRRIDPGFLTQKFASYPATLVNHAKTYNVTLPNLESARGQGLALLAQPGVAGTQYVTREDAETFLRNIGIRSRDAIQAFNKPTGFERINMLGKYCLMYPYVVNTTDIDKRKGGVDSTDRDTRIHHIKDFYQRYILDIPNDKWHISHLDPTIPDGTTNNIAYHPPIQARYRNKFKFDEMFRKMWPTGKELCSKMDTYYTKEEQEAIYTHLKKKFGTK